MKKLLFIFCILLLIAFSAFAQEKKDTLVAKKKHIFSISQLTELNYSNDEKLTFKDNLSYEHPGYSPSLGVTVNWKLNKYFSIGTGLIIDEFYVLHYGPTGIMNSHQSFSGLGIPIIPDLFYSWKRVSIHLIPEIRVDIITGANIDYLAWNGVPNIDVEWSYNNCALKLFCPKLGASYIIYKGFSLSVYLGIKDSLAPISQTNINSPWFGIKTSLYSFMGGLGINFKL
jgi:hypothetical protein